METSKKYDAACVQTPGSIFNRQFSVSTYTIRFEAILLLYSKHKAIEKHMNWLMETLKVHSEMSGKRFTPPTDVGVKENVFYETLLPQIKTFSNT